MVRVGEYEVRKGLYYSENHVWLKVEGDVVRVGITDCAQKSLKQVVNVSLIDKGASVSVNDPLASVESVKAIVDVLSPVSGTVEEVNEAVKENPSLINEDPYGSGWLVVVRPNSLNEDLAKLMTFEKAVEWHKSL